MTDTFKLISQQVLPVSATGSETVVGTNGLIATGTSNGTIIRHLRVVNTDTVTRNFTMWIARTGTGNTLDVNDVIVPPADLSDGGWAEFEGTIILNSGDRLFGQASVGSVISCTSHGLEMAP